MAQRVLNCNLLSREEKQQLIAVSREETQLLMAMSRGETQQMNGNEEQDKQDAA